MKQAMASAKKKTPTKSTNTPSILHPPYFHMICEAITWLKDRKGSSQPAIAKLMDNKYQNLLPPNFKKTLSVQLKKLVKSERLMKIKNSYKISPSEKVKMVSASVKQSQNKKDVLKVKKPNNSFKIKKSYAVSASEKMKMVAVSSTRGSHSKSNVFKKVEKRKRLSQKVKTSMALKKKSEAKKNGKKRMSGGKMKQPSQVKNPKGLKKKVSLPMKRKASESG